MSSPTPVANAGPPAAVAAGHEPSNLGDILERVLDRGIVIAGDIQVSLLDIELLTLKLRLVIASVDTAREMGIDWWESDPWLSARPRVPVAGTREGAATVAPQVTSGRRTPRDERRLAERPEVRDARYR
jgi:hypothetical protein